jgi:hypothetical protein
VGVSRFTLLLGQKAEAEEEAELEAGGPGECARHRQRAETKRVRQDFYSLD